LEAILSRLLHDPVSVYLLAGDILATIAVGLGIIWEHGSADIRRIANRFVIGGIAAETICTALLFAWDANVIGVQNDKIIALEEQLASRTLNNDQQEELVSGLDRFGGTEYDASVEALDQEQIQFLNSLIGVLKRANWNQVNWRYSAGGITHGIGIGAEIGEIPASN
jgi:hypothetical protein